MIKGIKKAKKVVCQVKKYAEDLTLGRSPWKKADTPNQEGTGS